MKCPFCKAITSASQTSDVCRNCGQRIPSPPRVHYTSAVRNQVFEVVVRQAMAGAPWREICRGPMSDNNITVEEVEAEVRRRFEFMGGKYRSGPVPPEDRANESDSSMKELMNGFISRERYTFIQKKLRIRVVGLREQLKETLECGSSKTRDEVTQLLKEVLLGFDDLIRDLEQAEVEGDNRA